MYKIKEHVNIDKNIENINNDTHISDILNHEKIKELYFKTIPKESLFNYIIENSLYLSMPLLNYMKYSKLNLYLRENNDDTIYTSKSIYIIHNEKRVNLMTYLYINDEIKFVIYGISLDSMDGEYRPNFTSYKTYTDTETELNDFINRIYEISISYKFFDDISLHYDNNEEKITNKHYIRCLLVVFNEYIKLIKGQLDTHINTTFMNFLMKKREILSKIGYDMIVKYSNDNESLLSLFIKKFEHEKTNKGSSDLPKYNTDRFLPKLMFYYRLVSKTIPNNKINSAIKEIAISYNVSKLKLNNISMNIPITYQNLYLKNFDFNNPNIIDLLKKSEIMNNINLYENLYRLYNNDINEFIMNNTNNIETIDILNQLNNINKNNITNNNNMVIILEYVGKTMGDFPYILNKLNNIFSLTEESIKTNEDYIAFTLKGGKQYDTLSIKNPLKFNEYLQYIFQNDFNVMLFNFIYTLLSLNKRLKLIHNDLHLNNITIQSMEFSASEYTVSNQDREKIMIDNNIDPNDIKQRLKLQHDINNIYKNIYSLSDKNKLNNTFIVNNHVYNLSIIDFSRSILCDDFEIFDMLDLIDEIFPFIKKDKKLYLKLTNVINDKKKYIEIFKIMSGIDIYTSFTNLYNMFTEEKKYNIIIPCKNTIQLIKNIKNETYKIMYKNLMNLLSNKSGKKIYEYTNETILYRFFNKYLLKNFKKTDFLEINQKNSIFNIFPSQELFIDAYNKHKYIIRHHFNINNPFTHNNIDDLLNNLYNKL